MDKSSSRYWKKLFNAKDAYEAKYQLIINKKESARLKLLNDSIAFIGYWNDMDDTYKNI